MSPEGFELDTSTDILLTFEIYKSFSYDEKEKFLKSQDGEVFFRKIRFSPMFKSLPASTARLVDILAGTAQTGYFSREGKLGGSPAEEIESAVFPDKRLMSNVVESAIQASINDPPEYWIKSSDLTRMFKASPESIDAALKDSLDDGRIAKGTYANEAIYASC
jgi:hypothetical protein